jgi:ATP synthase protein I
LKEPLKEVATSVGAGAEAAGFFASIMSGMLLGFLGDRWLGTDPLLIVLGIIAGSVIGFWKMWAYAKRQDDQGR